MSILPLTDYTLERDNRELQLAARILCNPQHYTLERDNRELQHEWQRALTSFYYTLERDNRELQRRPIYISMMIIIPLREIIGNYNANQIQGGETRIIPLREIIGNYNTTCTR